jgi:putative peptide zinc metalloprotease protein
VVLATIVTIGFNANPLMRYDGYYIIVDLVSMPNLRQTSIEAVQRLGKRWLLGIKTPAAPGGALEQALLVTYGTAASLYRVVLVVMIGAVIAWKIHVVGLLFAAFFVGSSLAGMVIRGGRYLRTSAETRLVRARAVTLGVGAAVVVPLVVLLLPVPAAVVSPGVSGWEFEQTVYCTSPGFLSEAVVRPGDHVEDGDPLAILRNEPIVLAVAHSQAERERQLRVAESQFGKAPSSAYAAGEHLVQAERLVNHNRRQHAELKVRAADAGTVMSYPLGEKRGRYVRTGEPVAMIGHGTRVVRTLLTAEQMAEANPRVGNKVKVRLAGTGEHVRDAVVLDVPPQGDRVIEYAGLTQVGGGEIAARPDTLSAAEPFFEVLVSVASDDEAFQAGRGAWVRFGNPAETLGVHIQRRFLRFLNSLRGARN